MPKLAFVFSLILCVCTAVAAQDKPERSYVPVRVYDPARNAAQDVLAAQEEAKRTNRNVLLDVGGDWCVWCHIMDRFFQQNPDLDQLRESNFVTVFVNVSKENKNQELLSRYPKVPGYPHLFVLDSSGKLLHSQGTASLEQERGYNHKKMRSFLSKWGPATAPK